MAHIDVAALSGLEFDLVVFIRNNEARLLRLDTGSGHGKDWPFRSNEALILAHGRIWQHRPKPDELPWGAMKQCFKNAADIALIYPDRYTYCEGYGYREGLPIAFPHAWVVDREGNVADTTWRSVEGGRLVYLGIPFRTDYLARVLIRNGRYGLLEDWENEWPLLRGADTIDEAVQPWPNPSEPAIAARN